MKNIEDWRRRIDEIDRQLVELLNERSQCAAEIGHIKQQANLPLYQPEREKEVLARMPRGITTGRCRIRPSAGCSSAYLTKRAPSSGMRWNPAGRQRTIRRKNNGRAVGKKLFPGRKHMVVVMHQGATDEQIQKVIDRLTSLGFDVHRSTGACDDGSRRGRRARRITTSANLSCSMACAKSCASRSPTSLPAARFAPKGRSFNSGKA